MSTNVCSRNTDRVSFAAPEYKNTPDARYCALIGYRWLVW